MFKKEMTLEEWIKLEEVQTLIEEGLIVANAVEEMEEDIDENVDPFIEEINKTGMLK
jgi:N-acetylmuramic acid 6-phosphate (MurNAc-6-P) etherase